MTRTLATVQKVENIQAIEGKDRIQQATVMGWSVVVKAGEFQEGDFCIFFEADSVLPGDAEWASFMAPKGFRVRTTKLGGVVSNGLVLPTSILGVYDVALGEDVTDRLNVTKYESDKAQKEPSGKNKVKLPPPNKRGDFPPFIPKTDEKRLQSCMAMLHELKGHPYYITEKVDGSSVTFFKDTDGLHVCSRNMDLVRQEGCKYWETVLKYGEENIPGGVVFQGELYGPGVQQNHLGTKELAIRLFTVLNLQGERLDYTSLVVASSQTRIPMVRVMDAGESFNHTLDSLLSLASGKYEGTTNNREGIVVRPHTPFPSRALKGKPLSFKVLNTDFLLKEEG